MKHLYLPAFDSFIRWHQVGRSGPTLVYLPGLSFPAVANFIDVATHPAMSETTGVMIDYLGSGSSDHSATFPHTLESHADCVAAVIDHLDCGACVLVGHSMGGSVAIAVALRRPDLVSQLVVAEGNVTPGGVAARKFASYARNEFLERVFPGMMLQRRAAAIQGDPVAACVYGAWAHVDPAGLYASSRALVDLPRDFLEKFLALGLPRAFVYGERTFPGNTGKITPDAPDPDALSARGVSIHVVPAAGHLLMLDNPDGFVRVLEQSLDRTRGQ